MHVVICGAGAIGASSAYFLAETGAKVTVVERTGVACAASGKSGGFLALDWCDGTPLMRLARRSFELHAQLADLLKGDWGYRRLTTYGGECLSRGVRGAGPGAGAWLSEEVRAARRLGSTATTAQVHPGRFTAGMMRAAQERGAVLREGRVTGIPRRSDGRIRGVEVDGEELQADIAVLAMGPWSILASEWLSLPPVFGLKGHSLVLDTGGAVPPEALFLDYQEPDGSRLSSEVFPRPDGTTYVCAISSESPLPVDPGMVAPDPGAFDRLRAICTRISPTLAGAPVLAGQACYRPVTQDGLPLIGAVAGAPGAYVATGHSVWGILNAPATGEAMAELILDGEARTVDIAAFDLGRLRPYQGRILA
jgi:glycine/D-amino acid oxidase-like deaminating enzyme